MGASATNAPNDATGCPTMPLTDTAIKALQPRDKPYRVFDGGGLYIEISPTGSKLWRAKYHFGAKEKRLSIGIYPVVSLRQARAKLAEAKALLNEGKDPSELKKKEQASSKDCNTFLDVSREWMDKKGIGWSESHRRTVVSRLNRIVYPEIGAIPVMEIIPTTVLGFIRKLEDAGLHETAHRVLGICSMVFRYAVGCGYCPSDPCRDLRGVLSTYSAKPMSAITDPAEAGALMTNIMEYNGYSVVKMALLWSAYTFCRPGEVRRAEWSEVFWDAQEWRIPAEKMKMKQEHRVPLCSQCMEILDYLKRQSFSERWIFASVRPSRPLSDNGVLSALRRMGYEKSEMTAHGFRAMASTLLNELGFRPDLIERQLAHGDPDKIRAIYNRAAYMNERRVMMQKWADYLDGLREQHSRLGRK